MTEWTWAANRGVVRVGGADAEEFLQGLVSNDVAKAEPDKAVYAALLTPQGKFLHDFFVLRSDEDFLLDCDGERRADLLQRLKRYKLRAKVDLADETDVWRVAVAWGEGDAPEWDETVLAYPDPRLAALGFRALVPADAAAGLQPTGDFAAYERLRRSLGVPSAPEELQVDKSFLMESGFDELNGIDWQKGCYVGQEVTARTKYRGLVRRRLTPVTISDGSQAGQGLVLQDGRDVGDLRSCQDGVGLAMLKLEALDTDAPMLCDGAVLTPARPVWWRDQSGSTGAAAE